MAERATVARPYAKAAFAYAREQGKLDPWSRWLGTARSVVLSDQYAAFERSPGVQTRQLLELVAGICGHALHANGRAFLELLESGERGNVCGKGVQFGTFVLAREDQHRHRRAQRLIAEIARRLVEEASARERQPADQSVAKRIMEHRGAPA